MQKVVNVQNEQAWLRSIPTLGQGDHTLTVWPIETEAEAAARAPHIVRAFEAGNITEKCLPQAALLAAFAVAKQGGRHNLSHYTGLRTRLTAFGGGGYPLSGLHVDTHIVDGTPKSAPYKCLYVAEGVIEAYFRLLPPDFLGACSDEKDEMLGDRAVPNLKSCTRMAMRQGIEDQFVKVTAAAGTILAFTAAGNPSVNAAPTEHEIRSVTEHRVTIPLEDYIFRRS